MIPNAIKIFVYPSPVIERVNDTILSFKKRNAITNPIQIIQNITGSLEDTRIQSNIDYFL